MLKQLVAQTNADLTADTDLDLRPTIDEDKTINVSNATVLSTLNDLKQQVENLRKERSVKPASVTASSNTSATKQPTQSKTAPPSAPSTKAAQPDKTSAQQKVASSAEQRPTDRASPEKIQTVVKNVLLAGSSIINRVNTKGLRPNVHKHAIPGATIQTLMAELRLYNMKNFECVFVYVGGNDIANETDLELIEETYDQLIVQLKASNPTIRVLVSKVAPRGDTDVSPLNAIIERIASHHDIDAVDIFRAFHDQNGLLCTRYFNSHDSIHPSPSGIKRILGTLNQKVSVVHDFNIVADSRRFQPKQHKIDSRKTTQSTKCFKCGEFNHETRQCRHRSAVTCWGCGFSGHKQQHCWSYP